MSRAERRRQARVANKVRKQQESLQYVRGTAALDRLDLDHSLAAALSSLDQDPPPPAIHTLPKSLQRAIAAKPAPWSLQVDAPESFDTEGKDSEQPHGPFPEDYRREIWPRSTNPYLLHGLIIHLTDRASAGQFTRQPVEISFQDLAVAAKECHIGGTQVLRRYLYLLAWRGAIALSKLSDPHNSHRVRYRLNARAFHNRRFIVQQYNPKAVANWQHWYPDEWTDMLLLEAAYTRGPQYWHDRFHALADMTGTRAILDELERDGFFYLSGTSENFIRDAEEGSRNPETWREWMEWEYQSIRSPTSFPDVSV